MHQPVRQIWNSNNLDAFIHNMVELFLLLEHKERDNQVK